MDIIKFNSVMQPMRILFSWRCCNYCALQLFQRIILRTRTRSIVPNAFLFHSFHYYYDINIIFTNVMYVIRNAQLPNVSGIFLKCVNFLTLKTCRLRMDIFDRFRRMWCEESGNFREIRGDVCTELLLRKGPFKRI